MRVVADSRSECNGDLSPTTAASLVFHLTELLLESFFWLSCVNDQENNKCKDRAEQERGSDFVRLSNALVAPYPQGSEERRLLEAMSLALPL